MKNIDLRLKALAIAIKIARRPFADDAGEGVLETSDFLLYEIEKLSMAYRTLEYFEMLIYKFLLTQIKKELQEHPNEAIQQEIEMRVIGDTLAASNTLAFMSDGFSSDEVFLLRKHIKKTRHILFPM